MASSIIELRPSVAASLISHDAPSQYREDVALAAALEPGPAPVTGTGTGTAINDSNDEEYKYTYELPSSLEWIEDIIKNQFRLEKRRATIRNEVLAGLTHFIACLYLIVVIPQQLGSAGFSIANTTTITAICTGLGCILGGLFSNLPFVLAPNTAISIFYAVYLHKFFYASSADQAYSNGSACVVVSGVILFALGYRPFAWFVTLLIPLCIQYSVAVGIGLITALAGCSGSNSIGLIIAGSDTLDQLNVDVIDSAAFYVAMAGIVIIAISLTFHYKGGFCMALVFCSIVYWIATDSFPEAVASVPILSNRDVFERLQFTSNMVVLVFDLVILYVITLNGLVRSFSNLAGIQKADGGVPRVRWLYIMCSVLTVLSGLYGGAPILISSESGAGIKSGAKTGLSTVVAGILFCITVFFTPLFQAVPPAATSPLLISIGVILFTNTKYIDWNEYKTAFPAFFVLFFVPFTYSVFKGALFGWVLYMVLNLITGDLYVTTAEILILILSKVEAFADQTALSGWNKTDLGGGGSITSPIVDRAGANQQPNENPSNSTQSPQSQPQPQLPPPPRTILGLFRSLTRAKWGVAIMNLMRELVNFDDNYDVPAPAADDDARRRISRFYFWHRQNNPVEYVGVQTLNTEQRRIDWGTIFSKGVSAEDYCPEDSIMTNSTFFQSIDKISNGSQSMSAASSNRKTFSVVSI